jgi:hypothetical protein
MRPLFLELRPALGVHQPRYRVRKLAQRIVLGRITAGFDEDRPAGAEATQRVVEPGRRPDQLGWCRAVKIRSPEPAILILPGRDSPRRWNSPSATFEG